MKESIAITKTCPYLSSVTSDRLMCNASGCMMWESEMVPEYQEIEHEFINNNQKQIDSLIPAGWARVHQTMARKNPNQNPADITDDMIKGTLKVRRYNPGDSGDCGLKPEPCEGCRM